MTVDSKSDSESSNNKKSQNKKKTKKKKKKSKSYSSKSISVKPEVYNALKARKKDLKGDIGGRITFSMVVRSLLKDSVELENVKAELGRIKQEADETQDFIKKMLKKAISAPTQLVAIPQQMQAAPQQQYNMPPPAPGSASYGGGTQGGSRTPSPPPQPNAPPPDLEMPEIEAPETDAEVKAAFNKERRAVFDGHMRKPSEILKMTKPEHSKKEVKEFKGKAPSLSKKSYILKNTNKFKKKKKREL